MTFNNADWIIIAVLSVSSLLSLYRGFTKEAISLLTWVAAGIITWTFAGAFSELFVNRIASPEIRLIAARAILFITTLLLGGLLGRLLSGLVHWSGLSNTDRILGTVFGFARGALVITAVLAALSLISSEESWWQNSVLLPHFMVMIHYGAEMVANWFSP